MDAGWAVLLEVLLLPLLGQMQGTAVPDTNILRPQGGQAETTFRLFILLFAVCGVIFLIVEIILIFTAIRFRARGRLEREPPQVYGADPIELAWTIAPLLTVLVLGMVSARIVWELRPKQPPENALFVELLARRWWWGYTYPEYHVVTANELHVPAGRKNPRVIWMNMQSADVIHSWWVPELAGKTDVIPGRMNSMWFTAWKRRVYEGHCAEFCGTQHANMMIRVVGESPEDFLRWAKHQAQPAHDAPGMEHNRRLFFSYACANCHSIRGTPAAGIVGPDLTHLMTRKTIGAGVLWNTPDNLHAWVADPQRFKPGCNMPIMRLDPQHLDDIVTYLTTLD
jgi:cytochrome c oxidase subunit 2